MSYAQCGGVPHLVPEVPHHGGGGGGDIVHDAGEVDHGGPLHVEV